MNNAPGSSPESRSPYPIYTGLWTNWSHGRIIGATLTLTQSNANLLIAFVALFVSLTASYLWKIICFGIHAYLSTSEVRDVLHHQRQALLRNNIGPGSSAFTLIKLVRAWKKNAVWRLLPLLICTSLLTVLLSLASGFSSRVAVNNEVLIDGSNCGIVIIVNPLNNHTVYSTIFQPYQSDFMMAASIQATQCFSNTSTLAAGCGTYVNHRLAISTIDRNASCPFGNLCRSEHGNLFLDTGFHNSHEDLGVNALKSKRFSRRIVAQCAPLKTDGYQASLNLSQDRTYTTYSYSRFSASNYTYLVPNYIYAEQTKLHSRVDINRYQIGLSAAFSNGTLIPLLSSFDPIQELLQSAGDINLFYLFANGVVFPEKTLDPWYQATHLEGHVTYNYSDGSQGNRLPVYGQDNPGSPMACTQKLQWCALTASHGSRCTPLGTYDDAKTSALSTLADSLTPEQVDWIFRRLELTTDNVVDMMGTESLLARRTLGAGLQGALPENQWQLEVEHWYHITLAGYQKIYADVAAGPPSSYPEEWVQRPVSEGQINMCQNQKVISTAHVSFSVFGLSFLLVSGLCIIAVAIMIEPIARFVQTHAKLDQYSRLEWSTNGTFQLQRLAHEELGIGEWDAADEVIPTTKSRTDLAPLDISDLKHPRLDPVFSRQTHRRREGAVTSQMTQTGESIRAALDTNSLGHESVRTTDTRIVDSSAAVDVRDDGPEGSSR